MPVQFDINNESLDIAADTVLEIEKNSPFVQLTEDNYQGDYSLPFTAKGTEKNMRLLNYSGIHQKILTSAGIDAMLVDGGIQSGIGKIKIEIANQDIATKKAKDYSCYFLTGIGAFGSDAKDKSLRSCDFGGVRSFAWGGYTFTGGGFWSHIHAVANGSAGYGTSGYDYAFYPVWDATFNANGRRGYEQVINWMDYNSGASRVEFATVAWQNIGEIPSFFGSDAPNIITPMPYVAFILKQAIQSVGWTIEGPALLDADFLKDTMLSFRSIHWADATFPTPSSMTLAPLSTIGFDLKDFVPDITVADFLKALKTRYGWFLDYDIYKKVITVKTATDVTTTQSMDVSNKCSAIVPRKINTSKRLYNLRSGYTGYFLNDYFLDFPSVNYQGVVANIAALPTASVSTLDDIYLVANKNAYYVCNYISASNSYAWELMQYNIFDYVVTDATEDITTSALITFTAAVPPTSITSGSSYMDNVPWFEQQGVWGSVPDNSISWPVVLMRYYGKRNNGGGTPLPYASAGIYDTGGIQVGNWGLSFTCYKTDGTDVGIYKRSYEPLLQLLQEVEEITGDLLLNRVEYLNFSFSQRIIIDGVQYIIKKIRPSFPYKNRMYFEAVRTSV